MLFTSLAAAATVLGLSAGTTPAAQPNFQPTYAAAVRTAAAQGKPLAVFVGHGPAGFSKLVTDGGPAAEAATLLGEKFVSVYVDADAPATKPLAAAFKVTDGLVISDKSGTVQALRHHGTVHPAVLTSYLTTYSDTPVPAQTVQAGAVAPVYAPAPVYAAGCGSGACAPAPVFSGGMGGCAGGSCGGGRSFSLPSFGGGCSGGSCGGGRMGLFR